MESMFKTGTECGFGDSPLEKANTLLLTQLPEDSGLQVESILETHSVFSITKPELPIGI